MIKNNYLVTNKLGNLILRFLDSIASVLDLFTFNKKSTCQPLKKLLLSNIAHMGDVVIATSILPHIKQLAPNCKIGFICGSWALPILQSHPLVDYIYIVDHWKINRANLSLIKKIIHYLKTKRSALKEIKKEGYDAAIDLYYYFPNTIPLLWQAKIPTRIGYISGGFGPLLTNPHKWKDLNQHMSRYNLPLLKSLFPEAVDDELRPQLGKLSQSDDQNLKKRFHQLNQKYVVLHVGSDNKSKEWEAEKWQKVASQLINDGFCVVFTGRGKREEEVINSIATFPSALNLCNRLTFSEFCHVIAKTHLLISIDSVAIHIADAYKVPTIVLFCGINNHHHIVNSSTLNRVLTKQLSCVPCHNKRGCSEMCCLKEITSDDVLKEVSNHVLYF